MTDSQRHSLRLSEIRERINTLNAVESLDDEQGAELRRLTAEYPDVETRYRAALIAEDEHETRRSEDVEPETRATFRLLRESRISNFLAAAQDQRAVTDTEADLLSALSIANEVGAFPLQLLDARLDTTSRAGAEYRVDTVTDLGAADEETTITTRPWIDRVFLSDNGCDFLGVTRETVSSGDRRYVAITGGTTAGAVSRGGRTDAGAMTISTTDVEPRRMTAGYKFRREDVARHGGQLETALRRDLRMVLTEHYDKTCIAGETGQYAGLIETGATKLIANQVSLKANGTDKPTRDDLFMTLSGLVDGRYATMHGHIRALVSRTVYNRIAINLGNAAADSYTVLELARRSGFMLAASDHLPTSVSANTIVGIASRGRGLEGTLMLPIWESATMIVDPYSDAAEGEVRLTLTMLFGEPTMVRGDNWRQIKTIDG